MLKRENAFALFLFLSCICHGMFFAREWLIMGTVFLVYVGVDLFCKKANLEFAHKPEGIFLLMIGFSLVGLWHPIRWIEGWLDAFRWLLFLAVYLWGKNLSFDNQAKTRLLNKIIIMSVIFTLITSLPGSEKIWPPAGLAEEGRFAAGFGYPNAAAAFFGSQIILLGKDRRIRVFSLLILGLGFLAAGSRAGMLLLIPCLLLVLMKRSALKITGMEKTTEKKSILTNSAVFSLFCMILCYIILSSDLWRWQAALEHLLNWQATSLPERIAYYRDSIRLALQFHFFPQAGGWLAFPFVQNGNYWTLDPHSSFCRILLNQGLAGVIILGIWAGHGLRKYFAGFVKGKDLTVFCSKTAALYIGLHSLVDADMSFGALGILFWFLVGINSD